MNSKFFVGLTFYQENSFSKSIESFRSRFDTKYPSTPYLHLPIVAPFEIESSQVTKLTQELIEELESFYFENLSNHRLKFSGIDALEYKKNKLLYLRPIIEEELSYCQESISSICQSYVVDREKKNLNSKNLFLTIGRFNDDLSLHSSILAAQKEFPEFTDLPFASICLFSKNNGIWYREADLVNFERPSDKFLQTRPVSI